MSKHTDPEKCPNISLRFDWYDRFASAEADKAQPDQKTASDYRKWQLAYVGKAGASSWKCCCPKGMTPDSISQPCPDNHFIVVVMMPLPFDPDWRKTPNRKKIENDHRLTLPVTPAQENRRRSPEGVVYESVKFKLKFPSGSLKGELNKYELVKIKKTTSGFCVFEPVDFYKDINECFKEALK